MVRGGRKYFLQKKPKKDDFLNKRPKNEDILCGQTKPQM
jgi:hypothetical protein